VQMPVMDGLEATRRIRALPGWDKVPIIALTANVFSDDRAHCLAAGMNDLIGKPINTPQLSSRLAYWLAQAGIAGITAGVLDAHGHESAPRPAENGDAIDQLAPLLSVNGVDCRRAVKNLRGKVDSYLRLVRRYVETHGGDAKKIRQTWAEGRREDAIRMAHTLKGVSGTLGFDAIQAESTQLEAALRQGAADNMRELRLAALEHELLTVSAAVGKIQ